MMLHIVTGGHCTRKADYAKELAAWMEAVEVVRLSEDIPEDGSLFDVWHEHRHDRLDMLAATAMQNRLWGAVVVYGVIDDEGLRMVLKHLKSNQVIVHWIESVSPTQEYRERHSEIDAVESDLSFDEIAQFATEKVIM